MFVTQTFIDYRFLYHFVETGTSDRTLIGLDQLLKCLGFRLYPLYSINDKTELIRPNFFMTSNITPAGISFWRNWEIEKSTNLRVLFIESSIRRKKRQLENQPFKAEIVNKKERKSLEFILIRLLKTGKKRKNKFFCKLFWKQTFCASRRSCWITLCFRECRRRRRNSSRKRWILNIFFISVNIKEVKLFDPYLRKFVTWWCKHLSYESWKIVAAYFSRSGLSEETGVKKYSRNLPLEYSWSITGCGGLDNLEIFHFSIL